MTHPLVDIAARAAAEAHGRNWDTMWEIGRNWWRVEQRAAVLATLRELRDNPSPAWDRAWQRFNTERENRDAWLDAAMVEIGGPDA